MPPSGFIVAVIIVVGIAIGVYVLKHKTMNKRKQAMAGWAFSRNLSFSDVKDSKIEDRYPYFKCLQKGYARYGYNVIEGNMDNHKICAFDYHCKTGSGKNEKDHYFSAVVVETDLNLKPLFIRKETTFDKVKEAVGFSDINFESTEFSKQFYVTSPDKKWAYDVLHQETIEFLLSAPRFTLEFYDHQVIAYREDTASIVEFGWGTLSSNDFEDAIKVITGVLDRLPASLVQELKGKQ